MGAADVVTWWVLGVFAALVLIATAAKGLEWVLAWVDDEDEGRGE